MENVEIDATIHDLLGEYKLFVKDVEGEEPTDGAICSAALERLFAADQAFAQYKDVKRKDARSSPSNGRASARSAAIAASTGSAGSTSEKAKKIGD